MTGYLVEERPQPGPPRPWRFPAFERREIAGGRVIACHLPGKPLAVVSLVVDAGASTEPTDTRGIAGVLAAALSEGTETRDAYSFAVAGERLGAAWHSDAEWDSLRCGFELPAGELLAGAELLAEAVRRPAFEDATVQRVRDERLDEIQIDRSQPGPRAAATFAAAVFTPASRYSVVSGGDLAGVEAVTPEAVRAFHRARFGPQTATLVLAGDLSGADIDAVGRAVFEGWSSDAQPAPPTTVEPLDGGRRVILVDRPGSVQSMLYSGHTGPARSTSDYVPVTTMALALGGMFNSRLNFRLREEKGYTYGAFGSFDCRRHGGIFAGRSAVQSEVTVPALVDLVGEITLMHESGLDEKELDRARSYRAGIFPVNFASPGAVAYGLSELVVHGFADDHFDRLRADIEAVTVDAVNEAAAKRLRPDELVMVVVGDAAKLSDDLEKAALGPVDVITDEG